MKLNTDAVVFENRPVSEFMTTDSQSVEVDAKVAFAVQRVDVGDYRHLPVVSAGGALTGVIAVRDILRYLTARMTATEGASTGF
ncbi:MAG: CBS domain-containing protein [Acidobacteriota bacterium]|nr:CBS domain-containing protein [Acidobacteriota bacterium]